MDNVNSVCLLLLKPFTVMVISGGIPYEMRILLAFALLQVLSPQPGECSRQSHLYSEERVDSSSVVDVQQTVAPDILIHFHQHRLG